MEFRVWRTWKKTSMNFNKEIHFVRCVLFFFKFKSEQEKHSRVKASLIMHLKEARIADCERWFDGGEGDFTDLWLIFLGDAFLTQTSEVEVTQLEKFAAASPLPEPPHMCCQCCCYCTQINRGWNQIQRLNLWEPLRWNMYSLNPPHQSVCRFPHYCAQSKKAQARVETE